MGIFFPVIFGAGAFIILLVVYRFFLGAPYVPSGHARIERVINLAHITSKDTAAELGSGDGRLVIALAQTGAAVHGFEISPYLVWKSRRNIQKAHLTEHATIYRKSFWNVDLSSYNVVVIYGIQYIMPRLEKKLLRELKPGSKIISVYFTFPMLQPTMSLKDVHLYSIPTGFRIFHHPPPPVGGWRSGIPE